MRAPAPLDALPEGFGVATDPGARRHRGGRVLAGGAPLRVVRLSSVGSASLRSLEQGAHVSRAGRELGARLVAAGLAAPIPGPRVPHPTVQVVIPTRDRPAQLERCLRSLGEDVEVLVVDDGSRERAAVAAACARHRARLIVRERPGGPAAARNASLSELNAEVVAFLDDDCVAPAEWLELLGAHFATPPWRLWRRACARAQAGRAGGGATSPPAVRWTSAFVPRVWGAIRPWGICRPQRCWCGAGRSARASQRSCASARTWIFCGVWRTLGGPSATTRAWPSGTSSPRAGSRCSLAVTRTDARRGRGAAASGTPGGGRAGSGAGAGDGAGLERAPAARHGGRGRDPGAPRPRAAPSGDAACARAGHRRRALAEDPARARARALHGGRSAAARGAARPPHPACGAVGGGGTPPRRATCFAHWPRPAALRSRLHRRRCGIWCRCLARLRTGPHRPAPVSRLVRRSRPTRTERSHT